MAQRYLSVSAAARLMGMSRNILQHKMQTGEIASFEGKVDVETLKKACPTAKAMDTSQTLERMTFIKDNAYASRVKSAHVPDSHVLLGRIKKLRLELKMQHQKNLQYLSVIDELRNRLQASELEFTEQHQEMVNQLLAVISTKLNQPLSHKKN